MLTKLKVRNFKPLVDETVEFSRLRPTRVVFERVRFACWPCAPSR